MKKYRLFISILATIAILILGGCGMTESNKEVKYKEEQDRMVEYLAQNYEGVEKIEFINFEKNNTTGTWSSDAIVNDIYYITFSLNGFGGEIDVTEHISRSKGKELHLKNGEEDINTSKIQKVYFEE
ncbi:TPA: DUF1433 domain-containing protein [Streptococcus suis]|uniref:DUF1433 domain-containing protein n=1 Tax=Streptococcus sp. A18 TaxID=3373125 RepID=UPI002AA4E376|nr:DUF1433 domain-containing protein [Streptococcus suis]HEM3608906.1 DUF1433 domain-containing protein [Streptococcus suis]HEM3647281.1 DUF1433 domain-containing protein [Streptococcus suis]HEM3711746.1 DUF1433 domain-containing protein [Streptococcus suis]